MISLGITRLCPAIGALALLGGAALGQAPCDILSGEGCDPAAVGCADGSREGFTDFDEYPDIASCGGAWGVPGIWHAGPSCGRQAGNHGVNADGVDCNVQDLCTQGWHVCFGRNDVDSRTNGLGCVDAVAADYPNFGTGPIGEDPTGVPIPLPPDGPGGAFFVTRTSGPGTGQCEDAVNGTPSSFNDAFGCGNLGRRPNANCAPLDRFSHNLCQGLQNWAYSVGDLDNPATDFGYSSAASWAWSCPGATGSTESNHLVKRYPDQQGGVLCCRDAGENLPELCDGIDNDLDGWTDEGPVSAGEPPAFPGDGCAEGTLCGTVSCTSAGAWACSNLHACDDATCDGVDDDEDGATDEDWQVTTTTCGEGVCGANTGALVCVSGAPVDTCDPLAGAAPQDTTCDGVDDDCDGVEDDDFVTVSTSCGVGACAAGGQLTCAAGTADDSCFPGPPLADTDVTCDGVDDDCDGTADDDYYPAMTSCGVGACAATGMTTCALGDASDTCVPKPPLAAADTTCDGIDDDCDGQPDDDFVPQTTTCGVGACAAQGQQVCTAAGLADTCVPGPPVAPADTTCDRLDDDCDGTTDEDFPAQSTSCGVGACAASGGLSCAAGVVTDSCLPGMPLADQDQTCDGVDDDCDGETDEEWIDADSSCGVGACARSGMTRCGANGVYDTCIPGTPLTSVDATCDGVDDDCDGMTDEDVAAVETHCGEGICATTGLRSCVNGQLIDSCRASDTPAASDATCDSVDDDCDGLTDEDYVGGPTTCGLGRCAASGQLGCVDGAVVDSCTPSAVAVASDSTCDGVDEDCDGDVDEDYVPAETRCGVGACAAVGELACSGAAVTDTCVAARPLAALDTTCDGADDDCDGLVDEEAACGGASTTDRVVPTDDFDASGSGGCTAAPGPADPIAWVLALGVAALVGRRRLERDAAKCNR